MPPLSQREFDAMALKISRLEAAISQLTGKSVVSAPNPPDGARAGIFWYDTSSKSVKIFDGREWISVGGGGSGGGGQVFAMNMSHFTSSGTITVTGCPFQPTCVRVAMSFSDASGFAFSEGIAKATTDQRYVATASNGNAENGNTHVGTVRNSSGTAIKRLEFSNFTADGVVLTVPVSAGTATVLIELTA